MLGKVLINVYKTSGILQKASIRLHATVKTLDQLFENRNMLYLYQGSLLNKEKEVQDEGICSNCLIVALEQEEESAIPYWLVQTSKRKTVTDEMLLYSNPNNRMELCRLRDLRMMKREFKPRISKNFYTFETPPETEPLIFDDQSLNIQVEKQKEPNTQALPVFW